MHPLIYKIFQKRGIDSVNDLSPEEQQTIEQWESVLSKENLSISDLKTFFLTQLEIIEGKWKNLDIENSKKAELIPYHTVYKTLISVIDSPKIARESLEKQLNELIQ